MAIIISDDVVITIDGTDYSNYINKYSESGGQRKYSILKMYGNNYKRVETGRTDFKISFTFRMDEEDLNAIFEKTTPFSVEVTDITNSQQTITYTNMLPTDLKITQKVNDLLTAELIFTAPAYTDGSVNREIVS